MIKRDGVGFVGADERVHVGQIGVGITGDHGCFAVAGRGGQRRAGEGTRQQTDRRGEASNEMREDVSRADSLNKRWSSAAWRGCRARGQSAQPGLRVLSSPDPYRSYARAGAWIIRGGGPPEARRPPLLDSLTSDPREQAASDLDADRRPGDPARRSAAHRLRRHAGHHPRRHGPRLHRQRAAEPAQHPGRGGHVLHGAGAHARQAASSCSSRPTRC